MRWNRFLVVLALLGTGIALSGCGKEPRRRIDVSADQRPAAREAPAARLPGTNTGTSLPQVAEGAEANGFASPSLAFPAAPPPEFSAQEKYDAALLEALNLLAEGKHAQALAALENARALQDTEQVRQQIDHLRLVLDQHKAAERTVHDIQTVLDGGKAEEAARLTTVALSQYGGSDAAEQLARQKREAEVLVSVAANDKAAYCERLRREAEAARRDNNLRAAAIALEQALPYGDDPEARRQLEELHGLLARYDENRRRAAELRRDPARLEDALAALQDAARAWDTLQVRQEIDEYTLALQKRRDRMSVADFEVRGDVGIPVAGRTVAEELLPAFKARFDLVERSQLGKVIEELRLEAVDLAADEAGRREVGRLANIRYLVLGSVTALNGITLNARLVDVRSGLVVQTARLVVPTPEQVVPQLCQLANMLMMTDEQKMAFEQLLAQQVPPPPPPPAVLPPPPPPLEAGLPLPPPIIAFTPRPPDFGGLQPQDFVLVPAAPPPAAVVVVEQHNPIRERLVHVEVELGDNLFRRGRYREAHAHFQLALNLSPNRRELSLRVDNCRPHLPPPPPVVVDPPPVVVVAPTPPPVIVVAPPRPRIAVLNFMVNAQPGLVPPAFGDWAAEQVASYFTPAYEVVERGEVCWYMGRLGVTMRDVLLNPAARVCLGRALNVRFFVFGAVQQTASFDVSTHLVDAETGAKQGGGQIHVQDHEELKLRMSELVQQTRSTPAEQDRLKREAAEKEKVLTEARRLLQAGQAAQAATACREGLKRFRDHAGLQALLQQAEGQLRQAELDQQRRREAEARQAQAAASQKRQQELAREAEAARVRAEQAAAARNEAERNAQEAQRQKAYNDLMAGAQRAFQQGNYPQAVNLFQSAVALKPNDAAQKELALARAKADEAAKAAAAAEEARREAAERQKREAELARVRDQVAEERRKREAEEQARRQAQESRDQAAYGKLLEEGRRLLAQGKYDAAAACFQSARQLRPTPEADGLIQQAHQQQALAAAQQQGARAKAELEKRLAEEKAARERADAQARQNQERYNQALQAAQKALAEKHYDQAVAGFQEAGKIFRTDAVLNGMRQAEEARAKGLAAAELEKRKKAEEAQRLAEFQRLMKEGNAALAAKQLDPAVKAFTQASQLLPGNPEARTALSRAQQARDQSLGQAQRQREDQDRLARYRSVLEAGRAHLAAKRYDAAIAALREAQQLQPADPAAAALLREAEKAKQDLGVAAAVAKKQEETARQAAEVRKLVDQGRAAMRVRDLNAAALALANAARLAPQDPEVQRAQQELQKAQNDARAADAGARQKKAQDEQRAAKVQQLLAAGRAALNARQLDAAAKSFTEAAKLAPADPAVVKANQDLDQARKAAGADAERQKRAADYQAAMNAGRQALATKRWDDAARAFAEAGRLQPGDPGAAAMLKEVDRARSAAKAAADAEVRRRQQEEQARRAEFTRLMGQGKAAMTAKRYEEAVKAYTDALKLQPGDAGATAALKEANQALQASKSPPKK